jgi:hypothetical protein
MATKKSKAKKIGNGAQRDRKRSDSIPKKVSTRRAKAGSNGADGGSASPKRKLTKKDYEKMTANELTLLAWEAVYANRHRRLT